MQVGLLGKANVGKSTFFAAATESTVQTGNFPFTTISPNVGVAYVRTKCPCRHFGIQHTHDLCRDGTRLIPVKLIDVAGLVPGAHKGKGFGQPLSGRCPAGRCPDTCGRCRRQYRYTGPVRAVGYARPRRRHQICRGGVRHVVFGHHTQGVGQTLPGGGPKEGKAGRRHCSPFHGFGRNRGRCGRRAAGDGSRRPQSAGVERGRHTRHGAPVEASHKTGSDSCQQG